MTVARVIVRRTVAPVLVLLVLTGCALVSPQRTAGDAPLELIATSAKRQMCGLNRPELAAGVHEVLVVSEDGGADSGVKVTLVDAAGKATVLREPPAAAVAEVELAQGTYALQCTYPDGGTGAATLTVLPADGAIN